ncbi:hypothetical protein OPV22_000234 [Ensete ventricosum]|uniref:AP2/ERF domain-containing protein n=1 Tax=Ensete ventricosum TaxID=4639 RepID=A0AAV8RUC9_ENSVE|nr:hypothetical protein OPV22_000234 [Ensete ventricosum]
MVSARPDLKKKDAKDLETRYEGVGLLNETGQFEPAAGVGCDLRDVEDLKTLSATPSLPGDHSQASSPLPVSSITPGRRHLKLFGYRLPDFGDHGVWLRRGWRQPMAAKHLAECSAEEAFLVAAEREEGFLVVA